MYGEGLELPVKMEYDLTLAQKSYQLAERWDCARRTSELDFSESDLKDFSSSQISWAKISIFRSTFLTHLYFLVVFLERLQSYPPLPSHLVIHLGDVYKFKHTFNAEFRFRFYGVAFSDPSSIAAKILVTDAVKWLIGEDETGVIKGRMKFCRPVFQGVYKVDKDLAVKSWEKARYKFHPIARKLIDEVIKLDWVDIDAHYRFRILEFQSNLKKEPKDQVYGVSL